MRNIPKDLIGELERKYSIEPLKIIKVESSIDGTKKVSIWNWRWIGNRWL